MFSILKPEPVTAGLLGLPVALALALAGVWINHAAAAPVVHVDRGDAGMVVSDSAVSSRIGRDILLQGGSAVDAAVATAFALAVDSPAAGNIGGGGFMIVRPSGEQSPVCIDYRETAPSAMAANSYTKDDTTYTQKAVGVPGTVRGLATAHAQYGKLPWEHVVMPAVRLAEEGVTVDEHLAQSANALLAQEEVKTGEKYAELRRVYGKADGQPWQPGDRLLLPDLARTLREIAEHGPDAFYSGRIAELLVKEMRRGDGLISLEDLLRYKAKVKPAMRGTYRGYTIIGAPPPSSGGTCVIQALNILENFDLASRDRYHPLNVHLIAEASRRVFADRARYLGDPDFANIPEHLTSKAYAKELAATIDPESATPSEMITPEIVLADESFETTHFSVIDGEGMAVSNTYTLEAGWGSRIVVRGAGFLLNNQMGDFNWFPGVTNRKGRIGTAANTIAPGKRMLSSQSPTMIEKDGRVVLVTGSPGGRSIINTVLCIVLGFTEFNMSPAVTVAAARMHHQWFPDRIELEALPDEPHARIADTLRTMGHQVENRRVQGSAHTIAIDPETRLLIGVSDYRRGGRPAAVCSETIALWDFADREGTLLSSTTHWGKLRMDWTGGSAGSFTDGRDHFRIQPGAPALTMDAYLSLAGTGASQSASIAVEVKIDSARFEGEAPNEQLRIGLTDDSAPPEVTARMIFGRNGGHQITLRGEALGGGTAIAPVTISETNQLARPIILRLELDTDQDCFRIASRDASDIALTFHGTGQVAPQKVAKYLRLSTLNDLATKHEYIDIDRIEVLSHAGKKSKVRPVPLTVKRD